MKSFIAKWVISILVNLRFKLLKYKENNKKICNTFYYNFTNIPLYEKGIIVYDGAITLKMSKMVLNPFCNETLHICKVKPNIVSQIILEQKPLNQYW